MRGSHFAYGHEPLDISSLNFICGISMKINFFFSFFFFFCLFFVRRTCLCRFVRVALYRRFFDFPIVSLWNPVNKISREPLKLGS